MTLEDVNRILTPPEGMRWEDGLGGHFLCVSERRDGRQVHIDPTWVAGFELFKVVATGAGLDGQHAAWFHGEEDLPAAYNRALTAVGLASLWTSEVPTTSGQYLLNDSDGNLSHLWTLTDGRWSTLTESGRVSNDGGWAPFIVFLPCPQPPKETS